ncbi:hypothetical protein KTO58_15080 [Chitinophaga pendula]|uniref:hypothetical protein n=1 Tax=Chitinophaga TaxID=79328 RepID=UPI000BAF0311|nr:MULTISPECIES: hypothetical protein [Chitinophaga]ASZ11951.1 hypothetical protein CK934_13775 [Chitinophaga sp. MD30]UCJ05021.1 hypothetical protein KTO58_15080 [Chitinophaga pendula]
MELNIRECDSYDPYPYYLTTEELRIAISDNDQTNRMSALFFSERPTIAIDNKSYEYLYVAFMQMIVGQEKYDLAMEMIRDAARILNENRWDGKVPLDEHFIAYAVDWSLAPEDIKEILKQSGAEPKAIAYYDTLGALA